MRAEPADPRRTRLAALWPVLPEAVRTALLTMAEASGGAKPLQWC